MLSDELQHNTDLKLSFQPHMRKISILFLQIVLILIGLGALGFLLWEPHLEGRNVNATLVQIYFNDPFLAYVYVASIPLFWALFQAFKVLSYVRNGKIFSHEAIKAVQVVKYCAVSIIGFVAVGEVIIMMETSDDRAGGVFMGILVAFCSLVVAATAEIVGRILQEAIAVKSGNEKLKEDHSVI